MAIPSLGLAPYNWWSEASTGVASGRNTQTTKFAFPITTGMSFNRTLWQLTGRQIGREARAMMNAGNGYSTFWAPVINLAREPRWGASTRMPPTPAVPPTPSPSPPLLNVLLTLAGGVFISRLHQCSSQGGQAPSYLLPTVMCC